MQVDELLRTLAIMRNRLMVVDGAYDNEQTVARLNTIAAMRIYTLSEDVVRFAEYCQQQLSASPDLMVDLLGELFAELGMTEDAAWEQFAQEYLHE
jgi:hypothetical protein